MGQGRIAGSTRACTVSPRATRPCAPMRPPVVVVAAAAGIMGALGVGAAGMDDVGADEGAVLSEKAAADKGVL